MSLLSVSTISNPSAGQPNILLNADGSVTLPVVSGAAPAQFQAGTLWFDTAGPTLNIRNAANTGWLPVGGGGGGTVTGVTGTLPIVSTGGVAPVLSINAATTSLPGSVQLADGTASKAGTSATLVNTPAFSVPKDAANMTGAALIPTGTTGQQPATPVAGMLRMNTTLNPDSLEVYDGTTTAWKQLAYVPNLGTLTDLTPVNGSTLPSAGVYNNITINAGVTVNVSGSCFLRAKGTITIDGTINANFQGYPGGGFAFTNGGSAAGSSGQGLGSSSSSTGGKSYGFYTTFLGSSGSSGAISTSGGGQGFSGPGGASGGSIIFLSEGPVVIGAAAVLTANGQVGQTGSVILAGAGVDISGSGGGSGGLILLQSLTSISASAGSVLSVLGGAGGVGAIGGATPAANGGSAGGGGYVILNAPSLTDASTKNISGGLGGAAINAGAAVTSASAPGAGFGGVGGNGISGATAANGLPGSAGQTVLNAYI